MSWPTRPANKASGVKGTDLRATRSTNVRQTLLWNDERRDRTPAFFSEGCVRIPGRHPKQVSAHGFRKRCGAAIAACPKHQRLRVDASQAKGLNLAEQDAVRPDIDAV